MTNNTFCIYQNYYNNAVLGDKRYHLTDSTFVLKKVLFVNLFLYKNVDLVHIYVTFLHTDITSFHRDVIFLQSYFAYLHTYHIITYRCHNFT